jgi:hypothetical protein
VVDACIACSLNGGKEVPGENTGTIDRLESVAECRTHEFNLLFAHFYLVINVTG